MDHKIREAFDSVHAEEDLKEATRAFLAGKAGRYGNRHAPFQALVPAALCALFLAAGGRWLYFTPTAEISIDINPSLELGVNRFDRVISVDGYNDEGKALAEDLHLIFTDYSDALTEILESDQISSLLSDNAVMSITVVSSGEAQSSRLLSGAESCTAGRGNTHCYSADYGELAAAHGMGLSYGKYRAFLEIRDLYPDITCQEVGEMTMKEIQDLTDSCPENSGPGGRNHHRHGRNQAENRIP